MSGRDSRRALAHTFATLQHDWDDARQNWRDERAAMFDESVMQHVGNHAESMSAEFSEFLEFVADVLAQMEQLGFPGPQHGEPELSQRQADAETTWQQADGPLKSRFGLDFGQFGHERFEEEMLKREQAAGRVRNVDFGVEYVLNHPDGGQVRYDYVDLKNHQIIDYKSARIGQSQSDVASNYREQRQRHIEAYAAKFGVVPAYTYQTYPSTSSLFVPESDDTSQQGE